MAYPGALIYACTGDGLVETAYEKTEQYALTRDFLLHRERYLARLIGGTAD